MGFLSDLTASQALLLLFGLGIAFAFEFVNGFHDTANAVATVIYTNSLRPTTAVLWSGLCNFLGVLLGGIGVAYSIVYLLPVDVLVGIETNAGLAMIMALLVAAISWNLGTWYIGLPASSSHALIGSILGAAVTHHLLSGGDVRTGVNWSKAGDVGLSLLLSPMIGFGLSAALMLLSKRLSRSPVLHGQPAPNTPPPLLVRGVLCVTCTGVSLAHGSNDGQKGMGLIMLVLIGIVPAQFALSPKLGEDEIRRVECAAAEVDRMLQERGVPEVSTGEDPAALPAPQRARACLARVRAALAGRQTFKEFDGPDRWDFRAKLLNLRADLKSLESFVLAGEPPAARDTWKKHLKTLSSPIEYVPDWVKFGVALALGVGTTVGWRRIVITVGERIGRAHLTYSQGACAELVAMTTIGLADFGGLPVSTTQVLSSGVAGTMWAHRAGVQRNTVRKIALAWLLTLPATMTLAGAFYLLARACL